MRSVRTREQGWKWQSGLKAVASLALLVPLTLQAQPGDDQPKLNELLIEETSEAQQGLDGQDEGYVGIRSRTATKMNLPLAETPRSVSIVTRDQMDDRASISVADALQYTPSIQANFFGEDNKQDWFVIRGFQQSNNGLYRDGTRTHSYAFYSFQIDPFSLGRVEILRGPASVLYGQTPPGGVINLISKRPQGQEAFARLGVEYGSYDRRQISADTGGPIGDGSRASWRLLGLARANGTQVDDLEANRYLLAPSFNVKLSDKTDLTLLSTFQKDDSDPYLQFLPSEGTLNASANGFIGDDTAVGNPDFERFDRTQATLGYQLDHEFDDAWSLQQSARYSHLDIDLRQLYFNGFAADLPEVGEALDPQGTRGDIVRGVTTEDGDADAFTLDNRFIFDWEGERLEHQVLLGVDLQQLKIKGKDLSADPIAADGNQVLPGIGFPDPTFNAYEPAYSDNVVLLDGTTFEPLTEADRETRTRDFRQIGAYVQDHVTIDDSLVVTFGGRYDDASGSIDNETSGIDEDYDDEEWTGTAGAAYLSSNGFTPYLSYSQYFQPILELDENGNPVEAERGEQIEAGVKYEPLGFDGYFNAAVFQITQENLTRTDPANGAITQVGKVESTGIELEGVANITEAFSLIGNATFLGPEITGDTNPDVIGKRPQQVSDTLASVWARYRFSTGLPGIVSVGSGLRYIGDAFGGDAETVKIPSYTLMDATVSYEVNDLKLQLAAKNLADEQYVSTCSGDGFYCWYGDRRRFIASVGYEW